MRYMVCSESGLSSHIDIYTGDKFFQPAVVTGGQCKLLREQAFRRCEPCRGSDISRTREESLPQVGHTRN